MARVPRVECGAAAERACCRPNSASRSAESVGSANRPAWSEDDSMPEAVAGKPTSIDPRWLPEMARVPKTGDQGAQSSQKPKNSRISGCASIWPRPSCCNSNKLARAGRDPPLTRRPHPGSASSAFRPTGPIRPGHSSVRAPSRAWRPLSPRPVILFRTGDRGAGASRQRHVSIGKLASEGSA